MFELLQVGDRIIKADEIIPLLANYQLLPQLLRGCLLTRQFLQNAHLRKQRALVNSSMSKISSLQKQNGKRLERWHEPRAIEALATRGLKIEKFKQETWGHKLGLLPWSQGTARQGNLLSDSDPRHGSCPGTLFPVQTEAVLAELAREYSQGPAETGGLIGPSNSAMLSISKPSHLWPLGVWENGWWLYDWKSLSRRSWINPCITTASWTLCSLALWAASAISVRPLHATETSAAWWTHQTFREFLTSVSPSINCPQLL